MSQLPNYYLTTDFNEIYARHPPPDSFASGMFRWPRGDIDALQDRLFREIIGDAWKNPFYEGVWRDAGLAPGDISGLDDIAKLPVVTVDDFKQSIEADPPFGRHQSAALAARGLEALKIQSSGGTTGRPRPTLFGPVEWEVQAIQTARSLYLQGARPGDVLHIPVTLSTANMGWCYFQAAFYYLGVIPITPGSGVVTDTKRQVELLRDWGANLLVAFPEYLLHMAQVAQEQGIDPHELGLKFVTTYLGPDTEGHLRRELEEAWGCEVFDNYGTHEIGVASFECEARHGLHFNEDTLYVEVVDVDTGQPVSPGETGNLVATSLYRRYPPLIRYNLMDRVRLMDEDRCACGSSMRRMDHFLGRSDDMVKLRGVNVYPMACLNAIRSDSRSTGEWVCIVDTVRNAGVPRDEMTVQVECQATGDTTGFVEGLEARLRADLGVRVQVEAVAAGSLGDLTNFGREGKVRRLVDRRPHYGKKA